MVIVSNRVIIQSQSVYWNANNMFYSKVSEVMKLLGTFKRVLTGMNCDNTRESSTHLKLTVTLLYKLIKHKL